MTNRGVCGDFYKERPTYSVHIFPPKKRERKGGGLFFKGIINSLNALVYLFVYRRVARGKLLY